MHDITSILPFLGLGAVLVFSVKVALPLQRKAIKDWAASNHYQLLESEQRFLREGPFTWMPDRGSFLNKNNSVVYYVKVLTHEDTKRQGHIRYAWVRVNYPQCCGPFRTTQSTSAGTKGTINICSMARNGTCDTKLAVDCG